MACSLNSMKWHDIFAGHHRALADAISYGERGKSRRKIYVGDRSSHEKWRRYRVCVNSGVMPHEAERLILVILAALPSHSAR